MSGVTWAKNKALIGFFFVQSTGAFGTIDSTSLAAAPDVTSAFTSLPAAVDVIFFRNVVRETRRRDDDERTSTVFGEAQQRNVSASVGAFVENVVASLTGDASTCLSGLLFVKFHNGCMVWV